MFVMRADNYKDIFLMFRDSPRSRSSTSPVQSSPEYFHARDHRPFQASGSSSIPTRSPPPPPPPRSATRPLQDHVPSLLRHRSRSPVSRPVGKYNGSNKPNFVFELKVRQTFRSPNLVATF